MSSYYLAPNGWGDEALWRDNGPDADPTEIEIRPARSVAATERWELLVRGAGLDGETVRVSRKDVQNVLEALSEPMMHESHFDAARRLEGAVQRAGEATR